jgi:hypothetical protein
VIAVGFSFMNGLTSTLERLIERMEGKDKRRHTKCKDKRQELK